MEAGVIDDIAAKDALILHLERKLEAAKMTMRDQFAMAALPLCEGRLVTSAIANTAYQLADAMMAERSMPCP